jgi:hypothetical protein
VQQQKPGGFRGFLQKPLGKALLLAATILVVFGTYVYVDTLVAIPAFLLFGLAAPIWVGLKAPRYLALSGLVVLLLVAPLSNVVITQDILTPVGESCSPTSHSNCQGAVLQNASVSPYVAGPAVNFTWTVTVYPQYLPGAPNSTALWLSLYVSTCPGATGNSSPTCSPGYPLHILTNQGTNGTTAETQQSFHFQIGSDGIWDWQMSLAYRNSTNHGNTSYVFLVGDPTYNGIEGPVVGDYTTTYTALILTLYFDDLLFLGAPFYIVLLLYMVFKRRERTRQDTARRAAGPTPPDDAGAGGLGTAAMGGTAATPSKPPIPSPKEGACPNCGAVVYANETTCWKCGADLSATPSTGSPLPSGKSP